MTVSEGRVETLEDNMKDIKKKLDAVHEGFTAMQEHMRHMSNAVSKLSEVDTKLTKVTAELTETRKDVDIVFDRVREMDRTGFSGCQAHLQKTDALEKRVDGIANKAWALWVILFVQLVQIYFNYMGG